MLGPGGPVPLRLPDSVRRTTTIDMHWPDGRSAPTHIVARGRDLLTRESGLAGILDHVAIDSSAFITGQFIQVSGGTGEPRLAGLAGIKAGGQLRATLRDLFPTEEERGSQRFLLRDDLAGATLVSSWGWFAWVGCPPIADLGPFVENLAVEKFDEFVPTDLLRQHWVARHANIAPEITDLMRTVAQP